MEKIIGKIIEFRDSRGWKDSDKPSSLAKSILIEAAELLELFQWNNENYDLDNIKDEVADILMYTLALSYDLGLNVEKAIEDKILKNQIRYPSKHK